MNNSKYTIFFDDGGVLNDNELRGKQWQKLVGEFFAPPFGGSQEKWGEANHNFIEDYFNEEFLNRMERDHIKYSEFIELFRIEWINAMFDYVNIKRPRKEDYVDLYYGACRYVNPKIKSAFPGVIESIKKLFTLGFTICTASGTESLELQLYLDGMGIKKLFQKCYGPDLVDVMKLWDESYYQAVFKDFGIKPENAIIIDDHPRFLNHAKKLGAEVIQACMTGEFKPQFPNYIEHMKDLPDIILALVE